MPRGMTLTGDFFAPPVQVLPQAPPEEARGGSETGLPQGLALGVAGLALLLSLGLQQLSHHLADPSRQYDRQLRESLVLTLAFYLLLGVALASFCLRRRVGLTWLRGQAVDALVLGLPLGALGGGLAVALNSAISGHLASDPNAELLVGGGGALRIGLTLAVTAVLAPLVEETLFRGVLAGTLLARGPAPAVWVSAIAFAVWHMNPTSLRYYVFMGLLLATLWRKRGLVASMSAHAAFNGVLTLAAVAATTGGGQLTQVGTITFSLPGGWHPAARALPTGGRVFQGPAGAGLVVLTQAGPHPTAEQVHQTLALAEQGRAVRAVVPGSVRDLSLPAGEAVTADIEVAGQPGHVLDLLTADAAYELVVVTGGSPAAERDWQHVLASLSSGGR
jgi:membrane protease YdiL (CAAX protease family)